jgi:methionine aminopeptidase
MNTEKRLAELEHAAQLAERARVDAWVRGLTDAELDAYCDDFRQQHPEENARIEAMTDAELDDLIAERYGC